MLVDAGIQNALFIKKCAQRNAPMSPMSRIGPESGRNWTKLVLKPLAA